MPAQNATAMLNRIHSAFPEATVNALKAAPLLAAVAVLLSCSTTPRTRLQYPPAVAPTNVQSPLQFGVLAARGVFHDIPWCGAFIVAGHLLEQPTMDILHWNDLRQLRPLTDAELDAIHSVLGPSTPERADSSEVWASTCLVRVSQVVKVVGDHRFRIFIGAPYPTICEVHVHGAGPSTWRVSSAQCLDA